MDCALAAPDLSGIDALYRRLSAPLRSLVTRNVRAPESVVEEACQIAWSRLHGRADEVRPGAELGWLCTTATREAVRMARARARETSLEAVLDDAVACEGRVVELPPRVPGPHEVVELRERLAEVHVLPARQQRMVWLAAVGYDYHEIAAETGDSRRTVERQLLRARHRLAASPDGPAASPRGPAA